MRYAALILCLVWAMPASALPMLDVSSSGVAVSVSASESATVGPIGISETDQQSGRAASVRAGANFGVLAAAVTASSTDSANAQVSAIAKFTDTLMLPSGAPIPNGARVQGGFRASGSGGGSRATGGNSNFEARYGLSITTSNGGFSLAQGGTWSPSGFIGDTISGGSLDIPFLFGARQVDITVVLSVSCSAQAFGTPNTSTCSANLGNTFAFDGLFITDSAGTPIPGLTLLSASGVDYSLPIPNLPSVPEPETALLLAAGLLAIALRARIFQ